ncbi:UNVERIFIED_CONTAM: Retrovirus-related Pol polyprotein from transposon RE1 [Sesamum latifolium]|uniref:Retrovirus-related Pol polyprotein from transposon RE1 n=1 Tax=Sesamum latifolium TaxID=2727402 RepID=A0AAW2UGM5_9LAMI
MAFVKKTGNGKFLDMGPSLSLGNFGPLTDLLAMEEKLSMIEKNKTWISVDRPEGRKVIGVNGCLEPSLMLMARSTSTKPGLWLKGMPKSLVSITLILLPLLLDWSQSGDKVYLLKKALYGLKQAPRAWYSKIDEHLSNLRFVKSLSEATLYVKHNGNETLIVSLYVDDLLVTENNTDHIQDFKQEMMKVFEMTDLGFMSYLLSMGKGKVFHLSEKVCKGNSEEVSDGGVQGSKHSNESKEKLSKEDGADKVDEGYFRSLIGCLMYVTAAKPDISSAISILSRFMHYTSELHLKAAKRVLRYVKGTSDFGVKFTRSKEFKLVGFFDNDWGGSIDDMRST